MTRTTEDTIEKQLCHLFPSSWLEAQAREIGMVQRQGKVDPVALFWTLLLSFGIGDRRDIATRIAFFHKPHETDQIYASSVADVETANIVAV